MREPSPLCLADIFRPISSSDCDVIAFTGVTVGAKARETEWQWFKESRCRDDLYVPLRGISAETTGALAAYIH